MAKHRRQIPAPFLKKLLQDKKVKKSSAMPKGK